MRRACHYVLRLNGIAATPNRVDELMAAWQFLSPFPEVSAGLERLKARANQLVVLPPGDPHFLDHLARKRMGWPFDAIISATDNGVFKPHPGVYLRGARGPGVGGGDCRWSRPIPSM